MWEKERIQVVAAVEAVVREMEAGSTLVFHSRKLNGVTITGKLLPYQTIGVSGALPLEDPPGNPMELVVLYLKLMGGWYRVNFAPGAVDNAPAAVDLVTAISADGPFPFTPIGWVQLKENGRYDYYSSAMDKQTENYEHPDLVETVMKLAVVHQAAAKK